MRPIDPQPARAGWRRRAERSSPRIMRFMVWLSLTLGRRVSRVVLYGIAAYFTLFAPTARRASRDYLCRVLGRPTRLSDGFRHVLSFATVIQDRVYWLCGRHDLFDVRISGEEHVVALRQSGRSIVFMGAHFGSFEALRALGERYGLNLRMLMYPANAQMLTRTLAAINPALAAQVIAIGQPDALLRVREHMDSGGCVGFLSDRLLDEDGAHRPGSNKDKALNIDFLGGQAAFPAGPFRLAALLRAPVVFMAGAYLGGNRYHLHFAPIADFADVPAGRRDASIHQAMHHYAGLLQAQCRQAPWNWFNFYDFWQATPAPDD